MLHIDIVCVGKIRENYLKDAIAEYCKRLSKYCVLTIIELPDEKLPTKLNASLELEIKQKESKSILSHIKKDSYLIALDLNGKSYTSVEFSRKIANVIPYYKSYYFFNWWYIRNDARIITMFKRKNLFF